MILRKSRPDVGRSGRVDVTVYADELNSGYWGYQPVCAIEVKASILPSGLFLKISSVIYVS